MTTYHLSVEIRTNNAYGKTDDDLVNYFYEQFANAHASFFHNFAADTYASVRSEHYNGWANRETWALNLWLSNDQGLYEMTRERVAQAVREGHSHDFYPDDGTAEDRRAYDAMTAGEGVKDLWEELTDPEEGYMPAAQALEMVRDVGSDYRVDWDEIGAHWLQDVTESPVEGDE